MTPTVEDLAKLEAFTSLGSGPHRLDTPAGVVILDELVATWDSDVGAIVVDIYSGAFTDPHIRIVNPPRYVPDPTGDVVMAERRWRDDPVAATAHVVAQHAGPRTPPRGAR